MAEGDLDSSIQDYMLFGSGFPPEPSTAKNRDDNIECVPQQDEISGYDPPKMVSSKCRDHQSEVSDSGTIECSKTKEYNENIIHTKKRKFVAASKSSKKLERQLMIEGDHSYETSTFSLRPEKYLHFGKTLECSKTKEYNETKKSASNLSQNLCQKRVLTSVFELRPTRETIQGLERNSFNINSNLHPAPEIENKVEPQTFDSFYTCKDELQNGDQLTTNNDFETCAGLSSITDQVENKTTPGDMKKPDEASNIPRERKEDSSFSQDDSPYFENLHISHDNEERENNDYISHWSSLNDGKISTPYYHVSTKVTDAASSMDDSSLNADSLYGDNLEQDLVSDSDSEACDKVRTHVITNDNTATVDAAMTLVKGGTVEKLRNLDLTRKIQDDKEMINSSYSSNKTDERSEYSLLEYLSNTNNSLHSNKSTASDVSAENTQVKKELSDNYEMSIVNEDDVQLFNMHEKINRSSVNDIRNIGIESSQTHQYAGGHEHKFNANILESLIVVAEQSVQLQEINYAYPQNVNEYTLDKYNLPSAPQNEIHFQQGVDRLLVGDTESSMEGPIVSNAEFHRNGRSNESIIFELANDLKNVRVDAFNTHHRETDFPVNHNEHYDHDLFGGPDESRFHQTQNIEGMSSTAHQHSLENSSMLPHNEQTQEIILSAEATLTVHTVNSFLSHHCINETSNVDSSGWANDISGEISVPVQEAISRSLSYESLHRNQERPMVFRQTSCPTPQSETNSFDEEQQRDFEYAMELQKQLDHEIFMDDEDFARYLDNSQRQTLSPPEYSSRRTEFFHQRAVEMISLNPQRMHQRQQHSNRHRRRHIRSETFTNRDGQRNRELSPEDMISLHENVSGHTLHSHETSQGNLQQRGGVAGANVADSGIPVDSGFQSVRQRSRSASNRDRPMPHRFDQGPVERVESIPGQSAQIDPNVRTPLTWTYQGDRRRREERRRQLETKHLEHQHHYQPQHWRTGLDLLPTEDYSCLDVHPSYNDPDEDFEIEDGEQYVSITRNRELSPEDMISLHENVSGHTLHSHETSQGNLQQRGGVAGANVADSGIPVGSGFQSVRQRSRSASNRDRPMPHRFDQGPVERVESIPGQSAQIDPNVRTPLTWTYQGDRRRREERRRQLETKHLEHQHHYQPQHWRTGLDLLPTEDYSCLDVHPSYNDPDEDFEIEDGEQYVSITSNRESSPEDMISLHENVSGHTLHSHETSQGNLQQRGGVAGANVADSGIPVGSGFQNVRQRSRRATNRDRPMPHRFDQGPVERVERIPGQSAQIDPNVRTPLTWNYQEDRRQLEEQTRQWEARHWEHQHHYQSQHWGRGLDLLPTEDYSCLDVHPSYNDPDEDFEIEDGEQYVSITSNRESSPEDMISLHENVSGHTLHSHETSQGNLQQRGGVAGANVADSGIPVGSGFQNVRQRSRRATNRDRPMPHRFDQGPVERVERIPGQSAQIDPNVRTPLTWNYQEDRRQLEEQTRQWEARHWEHQHHYQSQHWGRGLDLLPTEDYYIDLHPSYYDPDEVFEIEDGEQYASITQDRFTLRRFLMTRRPTFEMNDRDSYNELWNLVEMLGEVRHQGLDQTHIEMLPVHIFSEGNSGESKECNICLSAYSDGDEIRTLTCLHMFHTACIDEWLNRNAACPVCRRRIEVDDSSQ